MSENLKDKPQPEQSSHSLFTESGVKFLATYRFWIVAAVWLAVRGFAFWGLSPNIYVESYLKMAGDWLDGHIPYADFNVEYPPGALLLFVLPRIFTNTPVTYGYGFAGVMLLVDLGVLFLLWRVPALVRGSYRRADMAQRAESTWLCLAYIALTAVFGRLLYQNYDLLIGLLLLASINFALRKKTVAVDILLAAGIWFNLAVLAWIPLLWWYGFVSRVEASNSNGSFTIPKFVRTLWPRAAVLGGSLGVLFLPFFVLSGRSLGYIVQHQLERGTQLDSTAAGILMMGAKIFGFELATDFKYRAIHLTGGAADRGAVVCAILSIMVFVIVTIYLARMMRTQRDTPACRIWLIRGLLASILAMLTTSKVLLPQYLLWISPVAVLLAHDHRPRISRTGWYLFSVNLISAVLFFFFYPDLIELHWLPGILLLIRSACIVWLVMLLLLPDIADADQRRPLGRLDAYTKKYLVYVPLVLLFVWGTIAAFRPVRNADIWMNLRVAGDIVASSEIPRVDQYSAVAAGRPLLVHEWLSALTFFGLYKFGGGEALSVFRASIMLAMLLLLWLSLEKRARSFMLTAPILGLAAYMMLERVFVRPHLFTLLFLCIWVFCLERWRRERRLVYLIILVPLQILWANLHGGYLIAPVLGAIMTGTAALLACLPSWSKDESYAWSDVGKFAVLTAACLIASLINPHGLRLVEFSLHMGFASDYIKQFVYEWRSPLAASYMLRAYGFNVGFAIFIMMWLGLALNVKRRPLVDAVFALFATLITVQAVRFVPVIGIFGFPIAVRAWLAVADTHAKSYLVKRYPYLETALIVLVLASTLIYGFPYDKSNHRRIGWGLGGRLPYESVNFLVEQDLDGTIFNDYSDGAYLIHHLAPKIRPVMDSRIDIYGSELTHEYFSSRDDPLKFFQYLNKYDVSLILLMQTKKNIPVIQLLSQLPASKLLLRADERFLFSYDRDLLPSEISRRLAP